MLKRRIIFLFLFSLHASLFSCLTSQEITSIFEYSNNIKRSVNQKELSKIIAFLEDEKTATLLFTRTKLNKLYENKWSPDEIQGNIIWHAQAFNFFNTHDITNYNGSSMKGRNFILSSKKLFPSYLIKIPKHSVCQNELGSFEYQNVSRIQYNKLIFEHISKKQLKHIHPVKKCLIHVPSRPTELNDKNYALIAEKITSLYTFDERAAVFKNLLEQARNEKNEALELIAEILYLIKKVGLWDIDPRNILFIEPYKIAFIDTEKWWYEDNEFEKLYHHGITRFSKLLYGVPEVIETKADTILQ